MSLNKKGYLVAVILMGLIGFAAVIWRTSLYGIGITPDSTAYIFAAESFAKGNGFIYFGYPSPIIQWPILFPFILGLFKIIGISPLVSGRIINAVAFACIIISMGYITNQITKKNFLGVTAAFISLAAYHIFDQSGYLWTEPLFTLLGIWIFYYLIKSYDSEKPIRFIVLAGLLAGTAILLRFAGAIYILTGCVMLFFVKGSMMKRFTRVFIFGALGTTPFLINILSNYRLSGTLMGMRPPAVKTLTENISLTISTLVTWLTPIRRMVMLNSDFKIGISLIMAFGFLLIFMWTCYTVVKSRFTKQDNIKIYAWIMTALYSVFYTIYLIQSATKINFDPIGDRYLQPIYLPLVLLFVLSVDFCYEFSIQKRGLFSRYAAPTIMIFVLLWQTPNLISEYSLITKSLNEGAGGKTIKQWKESPDLDYIKENFSDKRIYSNCADIVYLNTDLITFYTPKLEGLEMYGVKPFMERMASDKVAYLIWFKQSNPNYMYNPESIKELVDINQIKDTNTMTIYEMKLK
jgi:hypothetical protein